MQCCLRCNKPVKNPKVFGDMFCGESCLKAYLKTGRLNQYEQDCAARAREGAEFSRVVKAMRIAKRHKLLVAKAHIA